MIPNRMNFFWAGGAISWMRFLTLKSFCHHNPMWDVTLYVGSRGKEFDYWDTHEEQDFFKYVGPDYFTWLDTLPIKVVEWKLDLSLTPVHQSDIFRWWLLSQKGGYYSDMDILYVDALPNITDSTEILMCLANNRTNIAFLGSNGTSQFYSDVYELALKRVNNADYQSAGTKCLHEVISGFNTIRLDDSPKYMRAKYRGLLMVPDAFIYPWHYTNIEKVFIETHSAPSVTRGIHWYAGTKLAQEFNNILTEKNYHKIDNTFCNYAKMIL